MSLYRPIFIGFKLYISIDWYPWKYIISPRGKTESSIRKKFSLLYALNITAQGSEPGDSSDEPIFQGTVKAVKIGWGRLGRFLG
jgi:hypothetical protein